MASWADVELAHAKGYRGIACVCKGTAKNDPVASAVLQGQHSVTAASAFSEVSCLLVSFMSLFDT